MEDLGAIVGGSLEHRQLGSLRGLHSRQISPETQGGDQAKHRGGDWEGGLQPGHFPSKCEKRRHERRTKGQGRSGDRGALAGVDQAARSRTTPQHKPAQRQEAGKKRVRDKPAM